MIPGPHGAAAAFVPSALSRGERGKTPKQLRVNQLSAWPKYQSTNDTCGKNNGKVFDKVRLKLELCLIV